MSEFDPQLRILPPPQRALWSELGCLPREFVLYGGTAIALRLGHRSSADFDFFSAQEFQPEQLRQRVVFAQQAITLQAAPNTLTISADRGGAVKVSFFGRIRIGRVGAPDRARDGGVRVASLLDLAATKLKVIQERAEKRDYVDLAALLRAGVPLAGGLAAAQSLYGIAFNPAISLKALTYYRDGDLPSLEEASQRYLAGEAARVRDLPPIALQSADLSA